MLKKQTERRPVKAVIDIGNSRIRCAIARQTGRGHLEILGFGETQSRGVRNGSIVNREALEAALSAAVTEAQMDTGEIVRDVCAAISYPASFTRIEENVDCDGASVSKHDIDRVARRVAKLFEENTDATTTILGLYPSIWSLDGIEVENPIGLQGETLSLNALIAHVPKGIAASYEKAMGAIGLNLKRIRLAHPCAVWGIHNPERDFPLLCFDFGGETTKVAYLDHGRILLLDAVETGCDQITRDIAYLFDTTNDEGEEIKLREANLATFSDLSLIGDTDCSRADAMRRRGAIQNVVQPRIDAMLDGAIDLVPKDILAARPGTRIALVGAGASLPGLAAHTATHLQKPARVCLPHGLSPGHETWTTPANATLIGLLKMEFGEDPDLEPNLYKRKSNPVERIVNFFFKDL